MNKTPALRPLSSFASWTSCLKLPQGNRGSFDPDELYCTERVGHVAACIMDELLVWGGYHLNGDSDVDPDYIPNSCYSQTVVKCILHKIAKSRRHSHWGTIYNYKREVWNYNLDMDRWFMYIPRGNGPHHTSGASSVVIWPYWYIFFGHTKRGNTNEIFRLNLQKCCWEKIQQKGPTISPRDKCAAWVYDSKIFIFGGYGFYPNADNLWNSETDVCRGEGFGEDRGWNNQIASFDPSTSEWQLVETKGPRPLARAAHSTVRVGDAVYIFGGRHWQKRTADLHRLDLTNLTWSGALACQGPQPEGRSWHTLTALNRQQLILMGGYTSAGQILDDLWLLNLDPLSWSVLKPHTNKPLLWHSACTNSMGDVIIYGGCTNDIFDSSLITETSDHVLTVRLEPFSLERLCLHALWNHQQTNSIPKDSLPHLYQTWLESRRKAVSDLDRRINKCLATSIHGPHLCQLSLVQQAQAETMNSSELERRRAQEEEELMLYH